MKVRRLLVIVFVSVVCFSTINSRAAIYGRLPNYDSGWVSINQGEAKVLTHNLGGKYIGCVVKLQYRSAGNGINRRYYGGATIGTGATKDARAAYWRSFNSDSITVYRFPDDLYANEIRVRIWHEPTPDYDSGWTWMNQSEAKTLTHNLGGNMWDYVIYMDYWDTGGNVVNQCYYGGSDYNNLRYGAYWRDLNVSGVTIYRRPDDWAADYVRIRIWKKSPYAFYHWATPSVGSTETVNHNLGGDVEQYVVDMDYYKNSSGQYLHQRYMGGTDFGSSPPGGYSTDDSVAAYWRSLTSSSLTVYRRPEDGYCEYVRIRIWRPRRRTDFDADGTDDFGCYDPAGTTGVADPGQWYLMKSTVGYDVSSIFGYEGTVPVVGDFDGDGTSDYGCYDAAGIPGLVTPGQWYFMKSTDGFDSSVIFGYHGTVPVVGDFDGDGTQDYGCYDAAGIPGLVTPGQWYFMKSTDGFDASVSFGYDGTVPVVGDFDGDGRDDYGCYDAAGIPGLVTPGQWYFMKSTDGFDASVSFGYHGTEPLVGDFDGDGTDDYGCYDDAGIPGLVTPGQWYFMKSTDGFDDSVDFGYEGTISVVGDYDGDGKADYGCYDPKGIPGVVDRGQWYFMKSTDGFYSTGFTVGNDTMPVGVLISK